MVFFYRHPPLTSHIPHSTAHIPHTSFLVLGLCTYPYMYMTKPMWHWTLTAYNQHLRLSPSHNLTLTLLVCTWPTIRPSSPRFSVPVKQFSAPTVIPHNVCYLVPNKDEDPAPQWTWPATHAPIIWPCPGRVAAVLLRRKL